MSQDQADSEHEKAVLAAEFVANGLGEADAARIAEIAVDHLKAAQRHEQTFSTRQIEEIVEATLAKLPGTRADRPPGALEEELRNFLISFCASGAFYLLQYYVVVAQSYFASAEPPERSPERKRASDIYAAYMDGVEDGDRRVLTGHLAALKELRAKFRAGTVEVIKDDVDTPELASILLCHQFERALMVAPFASAH
jgi:hypothetical protein